MTCHEQRKGQGICVTLRDAVSVATTDADHYACAVLRPVELVGGLALTMREGRHEWHVVVEHSGTSAAW